MKINNLDTKKTLIDKILIVGFGSAGIKHLSLARNYFPNSTIMILKNTKTNINSNKCNGFFFKIEEAIKFNPNLVIVANPAPFHINIAKIFAKMGSNLLIEKPLSHSTEKVNDFFQICKKNNIIVLLGYNLRFLPSLNVFKQLIDDKSIGNILSIRCEVGQFLPDWRPNKDYTKNVSAQKKLGGGVLLELSHEIDYIRWIFGEVNWVSSYIGKHSQLKIDVEDNALIICGLKQSNDKPLTASINIDFFRQDITRKCTAIGDKGSLIWNGILGKVVKFDINSKKWIETKIKKENVSTTYNLEWLELINSIKLNKTPNVSTIDGIKVLNIIEAIKKSNSSKKIEYVNEL